VFVGVSVGVFVGVLVGVFVGVFVGVLVFVGVFVGVGVLVGVGVFVGVSVFVGVLVGVFVGVLVGVGVFVGVFVRVGVLLGVGVFVGVCVLVGVGVLVGVLVRVGVFVGVAVGNCTVIEPLPTLARIGRPVVVSSSTFESVTGLVPFATFWNVTEASGPSPFGPANVPVSMHVKPTCDVLITFVLQLIEFPVLPRKPESTMLCSDTTAGFQAMENS
jgi:hypothetical protein